MNKTPLYSAARDFSTPIAASPVHPRSWRSLTAIWIVVALLWAALPSQAYAQEDLSQLSPEGERAAMLINQQRAAVGLPPMNVHPLLTLAANLHIVDMTTSGVYGHYSSDGSSVRTRIARVGYKTNGWSGENWAVSLTVDDSIGWWMTDPPHRDNVLNQAYTEMGIGTAPHPLGWGLILVVDFSTGNVNGAENAGPDEAQGAEQSAQVSPAVAPQPFDTTPVVDSGLRYKISSGDSLFSIGQRYGVEWQSIAELNGMSDGSILQIGADLKIPGTGETQTGVAADVQSRYTVAAGDTLLGIALRFGIDWPALASANGLSERSLLQIGAVLTIPGQTQAVPAQPATATRTHTIQAGETIWVIAARYNIDWRAILQANGLGEQSLLQIGQVLVLP